MDRIAASGIEVESFRNDFAGSDDNAVLAQNGPECVVKPASAKEAAARPVAVAGGKPGDIHRIGGSTVENLRLKQAEAALNPPGISALKTPTPGEAAAQMRAAFPKAAGLHEAAKTVGTTSEQLIRSAGFDIIANPTRKLPNHHRIIHPEGVAGFSDENLARLAQVFTNTTGH
jgi:hypothetical protein